MSLIVKQKFENKINLAQAGQHLTMLTVHKRGSEMSHFIWEKEDNDGARITSSSDWIPTYNEAKFEEGQERN